MGIRGSIAMGVLALASRARADHYDDLGLRLDPPGSVSLARDGDHVHGAGQVDGVETTINVVVVPGDWSQKGLVELMGSASTLPGTAGRELHQEVRVLHDRLVVDEIWEANTEDMRFESLFFPTAKGLFIAAYSTSKTDFDKSRSQRNAFFRNAIAFDAGAPGLAMPPSPLADRLRAGMTGPAALLAIADTKVKLTFTDTKKSKTIARAKIDQAAWDAELGRAFAELAAGGDLACSDDKLSCTLQDPIGAPVEYRFKKAKGGARLVEIKTLAP